MPSPKFLKVQSVNMKKTQAKMAKKIIQEKERAAKLLREKYILSFEIAEMFAAKSIGWKIQDMGICEKCRDGSIDAATVNNHPVWYDLQDRQCAYCYLKEKKISEKNRLTVDYIKDIATLCPDCVDYEFLCTMRRFELEVGDNGYTDPQELKQLHYIQEYGCLNKNLDN